jgi:hypothetical protein
MIRRQGQLISRQELFEQIWETPISLLSKKYGISDVGLAKICKRMEIPRPPRGYWNKLKVGKAPPKPQLGPKSDSGREQIETTPTPANLRVATSTKPLELILVPDILANPHPLTKKSHAALTRGKRDDRGLVHPRSNFCLDIHVSRSCIDRACRIMDTLVKALESQGYSLTVSDTENAKTIALVNGESLEIGIDEKITHTIHIRTPMDDVRYKRTYQLPPRYDYSLTGNLSLRMRNAAHCGRQQWADGKRHKVEEYLGAFIEGLRIAAHKKKMMSEEYERRCREWEEEAERRRQQEHLAYLEKKRADKLIADTKAWCQAASIRRYIAELNMIKPVPPGLSEWIVWARRYADKLDPLSLPNNPAFCEPMSSDNIEQYDVDQFQFAD